jgi:hypothetical protein
MGAGEEGTGREGTGVPLLQILIWVYHSGVARGGGSRGSRTPPIMPAKIFDHKKIGQHAIVLRLYTYDILGLFTTSRLS